MRSGACRGHAEERVEEHAKERVKEHAEERVEEHAEERIVAWLRKGWLEARLASGDTYGSHQTMGQFGASWQGEA